MPQSPVIWPAPGNRTTPFHFMRTGSQLEVEDRMHKIKSKPGTYCILFRSQKKRRTRIGRWGYLYIEPGYYLYVGSAFGPGGILSRVLRHCRKSKAKHWHMDYLQEFVTPVMAWHSYDPVRLEHCWARGLLKMSELNPINGFGCSDCQCQAHLLYTPTKPASPRVSSALAGRVGTCIYKSSLITRSECVGPGRLRIGYRE